MDRLVFNRKINGKYVECDAIATYHDEDSNKDFIVYTDKILNESGQLKLYYSYYTMGDKTIKLLPVKDLKGKKVALELIKEVISGL